MSGPENPAPALVEEGASLGRIASVADGCRACDLYQRATQTVFGEGPEDAGLMLVGEQPGNDEDLEGVPFVGPAGRVLDRALDELGVPRSRIYVTNIVKHFKWKAGGSPSKPRLHAKPARYQVEACKPWLMAEVDRVSPDVVVLMGATAAQGLLGSGVRVTKDGGVPVPWQERTVIVTIHPSAILRARDDRQERYDRFVSDLRAAVELSGIR